MRACVFVYLCVCVSVWSCDLRSVQHLCPLNIRCTKDLQLPRTLSLCHTHPHTHVPPQDVNVLLIAAIIRDSLPTNWVHLRECEAQRCRIRQGRRAKTQRGKKGMLKERLRDGGKEWVKQVERGKETPWTCNASRSVIRRSAQKGLLEPE